MKEIRECGFRWNALQMQRDQARQDTDYTVNRLPQGSQVLAIAEGSGVNGDWASKVAVTRIVRQVEAYCHLKPGMELMTRAAWVSGLCACEEFVRELPEVPLMFLPHWTLIAAHVDESGRASIAGFGDSKIWHLTQEGLHPLLAKRLPVFDGVGRTRYAEHFEKRLETESIALQPGERLILATRGIETVRPAKRATILTQPLDQALESLLAAIRIAKKRRQDNVTVVILEYLGAGSP
ncbi:hypothetical protein [Nevskia ramosa]|uniref:hypothetical protein n=1 Tax=Nevskia ramosa TaxID=64002 RepID=UPI003D0BB52A